jgi:hypothetical protein
MTHLELTDDQTEALTRELPQIIDNDRFFLSPRIRVLKGIVGKLRPEPAQEPREPLPPMKQYAPPRYGRRR